MGAAWLSGADFWNNREDRMLIGSIYALSRAADFSSLVSIATRCKADVFVCVQDVLDYFLCERRGDEAMLLLRLECRAEVGRRNSLSTYSSPGSQ